MKFPQLLIEFTRWYWEFQTIFEISDKFPIGADITNLIHSLANGWNLSRSLNQLQFCKHICIDDGDIEEGGEVGQTISEEKRKDCKLFLAFNEN